MRGKGEKKRGTGRENLKCENGWNSEGFENRTQDFITHTWTAEGMENPLPVCAHTHTHTNALNSWAGQRNNKNNVN